MNVTVTPVDGTCAYANEIVTAHARNPAKFRLDFSYTATEIAALTAAQIAGDTAPRPIVVYADKRVWPTSLHSLSVSGEDATILARDPTASYQWIPLINIPNVDAVQDPTRVRSIVITLDMWATLTRFKSSDSDQVIYVSFVDPTASWLKSASITGATPMYNVQAPVLDVAWGFAVPYSNETTLSSQVTVNCGQFVPVSASLAWASVPTGVPGGNLVVANGITPTGTMRITCAPPTGFTGYIYTPVTLWARFETGSGYIREVTASSTRAIVVRAVPEGTILPTTPTDLAGEVVNSTGVDLAWENAVEDTLGYYVYRRTGEGAWAKVATLPASVTEYSERRLAQGTAYSYRVSAYNANVVAPESAPTEPVTLTTGVIDGVPDQPDNLMIVSVAPGSATFKWDAVTSDCDGYTVYRSSTVDGPWDEDAEIARTSATFTRHTDPVGGNGITVYYCVSAFNENGEGDLSDPLEVYVPPPRSAMQPVSRFSLTPGCNMSMCQVAGRVLVFSDLDRPVVYVNRKWFLQGLKPLRNAPVVSAGGSGKMSGTVAAFVCLFRSDDVTRSVPSPISNWLAVADKKITITLHANDRALDNSVISRDIGYNQSGQQIAGCDYWEIYLTEEDIAGAYLVARVPITVSEFTVDYEVGDLLDGSHRPMETANQSLIPPACAYSVYRNSRVYIFGERTIKPTQDDADATITMANASRLFSTSDYTLTDALYHKELYINKTGTGWFVVDVIDANNAEIMHFDPEINKGGFRGVSGTYSDFAFAGKPSRVYASAYFSGEASGGITFSPETYPPTTIFEDEFDPDDNQDGNGAIASRDAIFFFKPSKAFFITGGETPDFPLLGVTTISRGSGLLAPKTLCRDRYDHIYYLSDQGPHMAHQGGVEKIGTMSGNAFLFQRYFDVGTAGGAVGTWFSRDDYFVVFGLNRRGRSGGRDGFIYDSRTNQICPFTTPKRITSCVQTTTDSGDYQLLVGDENGHVGTFLTADVYGDLRDYGSVDPLATEEVVPCFIRSGLIAAQRGLTPQWFVPRVKMIPDDATPLAYTVGFDGKTRSDDPTTYAADVSRTVTTALTNRVRVGGRRMQNCVVGFEFNAPTEGRVEWSGLEVTLNVQGTS